MEPPRAAAAALVALATLALLAGEGRARDVDHCYHEESDKYLYFASKTAYQFARQEHRGKEVLPHCRPLQVWWLNRHGTRYPGKSTIKGMDNLEDIRDTILSNHQEGTGRLCDADLHALETWRLRTNASLENVLTSAGAEELFLTGRRLKERFPEVLQQPYTAARYKFQHTDSQRTEQSAVHFAEGLFDSASAVHIPPASKVDLLLQPYTQCKAWLEGGEEDPKEWQLFLEGNLMEQLIANVSSRLGYLATLKFDVVSTIYDMCRYDEAWDVTSASPWCAAFSKEELKILEYAEDLKYYYKSGYGDENNIKLGCPLARNLYEHFNAAVGGSREAPLGVFYFAHSSTLHMLQARLGAFRDALPLRADNYRSQRQRQWRVSLMGSFAANLGAVLYACSPPGEAASHQVLFLGAEGPLHLPGCSVGLCTWEHVQRLLRPVAQECSLEWCDGNAAAALRRPRAAILLSLALALALAARRAL